MRTPLGRLHRLAVPLAAGPLLLAACSNTSTDDPSDSIPADAESFDMDTPSFSPSESSTALPPPPLTGQQDYVGIQEDAQGFRMRINLTIYDAIQGSDTEAMQAGWEEVGGTGEPPCLDASIGGGDTIDTQTAAYAFGTIGISNQTTDFDPPSMWWNFSVRRAAGAAMGVGYTDGAECGEMEYRLKPDMSAITDNTWGPVPVVFAYDDVYTPNNPRGDTEQIEAFPIYLQGLSIPVNLTDSTGQEIETIPIHLAPPRGLP